VIDHKIQIVIFSNYFYPALKAGGPVKSLYLLKKKLDSNFDIKIFTSAYDIDGKEVQQQKKNFIIVKNFFSLIKGLLILFSDRHSQILYFNSFFSFKFTIIPLILAKIFLKKKIIISPRGELFNSEVEKKKIKKNLYLFFFKSFLKKNIYFHVTSLLEKKTIKKLFPNNKIEIVENLSIKSDFNLKKKKFEKNKIKFVYLSRITKKKNLHLAIDLLSNINNNVELDIYGNIEDNAYWINIKKLILQKSSERFKINYKGFADKRINKILENYNFFILLSDSENFGHVILEAMMAGCIPVVSKNLPWQDIYKKKCGFVIDIKNINHKIFADFINSFDKNKFRRYLKNLKTYCNNFFNKQKKINYLSFFYNK
jgi:glycosyltransferase involved in cell wall biosynthesis